MKRSISSILGAVLLIILTQCNSAETQNNSKTVEPPAASKAPAIFTKMLGTWKNDNGKDMERWVQLNDSSFRSVVFSIKGKDTVYSEQANIYPESGKWVFDNKVDGQNNGASVKFTSTILNDNTVQFSNPAHDFPSDVNYTVISRDSVHAFIMGRNEKGGIDTIPFGYKKMN